MRVTLDLAALLQAGEITRPEHDRLAALGTRETGSLLVNVLLGFGVIAVSLGAVALLPSAAAGTGVGALLMAAGIALDRRGGARWGILASICMLVASLLLGAGLLLLSQGIDGVAQATDAHPLIPLGTACVLVAGLFAACAVLARSGLMAALSVLMLFGALGGRSFYETATYGLEVTRPFWTVVLFSALSLAALWVSRRLAPAWERLAIIAARASLFLVNLGFWIGSLWGDTVTWHHDHSQPQLSAHLFAAAWAVGLIATGVWAGRSNRRWALNLIAVFGGIHFYTQWFEVVGGSPASLMGAGVIVLIGAALLRRFNQAPVG